MAEKAITLADGREVCGFELDSYEADFHHMTWTFHMDAETRVGAGRYFVIHESDLAPNSSDLGAESHD